MSDLDKVYDLDSAIKQIEFFRSCNQKSWYLLVNTADKEAIKRNSRVIHSLYALTFITFRYTHTAILLKGSCRAAEHSRKLNEMAEEDRDF